VHQPGLGQLASRFDLPVEGLASPFGTAPAGSINTLSRNGSLPGELGQE
jgi:hypothetical protein